MCPPPFRRHQYLVWSAPLLLIIELATPVAAQLAEPVRSIRVHGEMSADGRTLSISQATKGQKQIRASVQAPDGRTTVTTYFADGKIVLAENLADRKTVRTLAGADAAAYLLDLLALNPEYHLRPGRFDRTHPLFEGFSLDIQWVDAPPASNPAAATSSSQIIGQIRLIDQSDGEQRIISTIHYLERFPKGPHGWNPRKIQFLDNTTGRSGLITLEAYDFNSGLLDFLFQPPAVTTDTPRHPPPVGR